MATQRHGGGDHRPSKIDERGSPPVARDPITHRAVERRPINILWLTGGLGCDGDSVALTAATNPSLEDLLRGCL
ncbi:MAG: hypothetical protein ACRDL5_03945, partial [Solirubrobacteraceae bacterium]